MNCCSRHQKDRRAPWEGEVASLLGCGGRVGGTGLSTSSRPCPCQGSSSASCLLMLPPADVLLPGPASKRTVQLHAASMASRAQLHLSERMECAVQPLKLTALAPCSAKPSILEAAKPLAFSPDTELTCTSAQTPPSAQRTHQAQQFAFGRSLEDKRDAWFVCGKRQLGLHT